MASGLARVGDNEAGSITTDTGQHWCGRISKAADAHRRVLLRNMGIIRLGAGVHPVRGAGLPAPHFDAQGVLTLRGDNFLTVQSKVGRVRRCTRLVSTGLANLRRPIGITLASAGRKSPDLRPSGDIEISDESLSDLCISASISRVATTPRFRSEE